MISEEYLRLLSRYNRWMNEQLYEKAALLSDEQRKEEMGAFFRSIHGTFNHLLLADRIWIGRFTNEPYPFESLAQELYSDFEELRTERAKTDTVISSLMANFTDDELSRDLSYLSASSPQPRRYPLWMVFTHFFNHQTHHRGQITTMLHQQGIEPGLTDLLWMPGLQEAGGLARD